MKEKIEKCRTEIVFAIGMIASFAIAGIGMKRAYNNGYQRGCDVTFGRIYREFQEIDLSNFWDKYHK